jgi:hypothetical protein
MPKHNYGFFEKFKAEDGTLYWLLWSDKADYDAGAHPERCIPATTNDNDEGCDLIDALQYGELD